MINDSLIAPVFHGNDPNHETIRRDNREWAISRGPTHRSIGTVPT